MGATGYADDLILLAPTRSAMAKMLEVCERYANDHNITFSTDVNPTKSKTKMIYMSGNINNRQYPAPLKLNGRELPFVPTALHLGHTLAQDGSMAHDVKIRRINYIDKTTDIRTTFSFAHPEQIISAIDKHVGDHYGLLLSDLFQDETEKYFRCWGTCVKLCYSVPRSSHRYFVSNLLASEVYSIRTNLLSRYVNFFRSCLQSKSPEVSLMAHLAGHDRSSVTGSNLNKIAKETGMNPWNASAYEIQKVLHENENPTPPMDLWRLPLLEKLLKQRRILEYELEDVTEISEIINSLCSS